MKSVFDLDAFGGIIFEIWSHYFLLAWSGIAVRNIITIRTLRTENIYVNYFVLDVDVQQQVNRARLEEYDIFVERFYAF